jgi:hypothetical protein
MSGGEGNDSMSGGAGNDSMSGGNGDDSMDGGAGNDTMDGGNGNDSMNGGEGNDSMSGGNGDDSMDGGNGNDTMSGGNGNDTMSGGNGDDSMSGGNGDDSMDGGAGNDTMDGGAGNDTMDGGNGDDSMFGGNGDDSMSGGNGNDTMDGGQGNDTIDGGGGTDNSLDISHLSEAVIKPDPAFPTDTTKGIIEFIGTDGQPHTTAFSNINKIIDNGRAVVTVTAITDDTGTPDFVTKDHTLVYSGTVVPATGSGTVISAAAHVKVELLDKNGNPILENGQAVTAIVPVAAGGTWSWDRTGANQIDGDYTLRATVVDAAGVRFTDNPLKGVTEVANLTTDNDPGVDLQTFSIDNQVPTVTIKTIMGDAVGDTGNGTFDTSERLALTDSSATITGTTTNVPKNGTGKVNVTLNGKIYEATVGIDGTWTATVLKADALLLNHGNTYDVFATAANGNGNIGTDSNNKLVVNVAALDVPTVNNLKTNITNPIISGTAQRLNNGTAIALETGDEITVKVNNTTFTGTLNTAAVNNGLPTGLSYNASTKTWSVNTATAGLAQNTTYDVEVSVKSGGTTATDTNSTNELQISNTAVTIAIDTISTDGYINAAEKNDILNITGTTTNAQVGSKVTINLGGVDYTGSVTSPNKFVVSVPAASVAALTDGSKTATASVTNEFGNSATPVSTTVIVDAAAPTFSSLATASIDENVAIGTEIYDANATDANAIKYSLKAGVGDQTNFTIDSVTGKVTINSSPNFEVKPSYTFTVVATDKAGNTTEQVVNLGINNLNEAPVNTVPTATVSAVEDTATAITGLSIADVDVDAGTGPMTVTLSALHGTVNVNAAAAAAGAGVTLTSNGTSSVVLTGKLADINTLLATTNAVSYTGATNYNGADTLTMLTSDGGNTGAGGAKTDSDTVAITVSAVNDAPTNTAPATLSADEDTATAITGLSIADVDAATGTMSVTLSVLQGKVNVAAGTGVTLTSNGTASVVLTGKLADINTLLATNAVSYTGATNYNGSDTLTMLTSDGGNTGTGGAKTASSTVAITVNAVNDAPVNTVSAAQTATEDTNKVITGLSITDVDAGTATNMSVTLSAANGTITMLPGAGTVTLTNNGTSSVTLTGTLANINTLLALTDAVTYKGNLNYNGSDTLTMLTSDGGNTGTGGAKTASSTVAITVSPVNDAPVLETNNGATYILPSTTTAPGQPAPNTQVGSLVSDLLGSWITDADGPNVPKGIAITEIDTSRGVLWFSKDNGAHWIAIGAVSQSSAFLINSDASNHRVYFQNTSGTTNLTSAFKFRAWDQTTTQTEGAFVNTLNNNGGSTEFSTDMGWVKLSFANGPVPVNTVPTAVQTVSEDVQQAITGISVNDADNNLATTQLSAAHGTLNVTLATGTTISAGSNGGGTLTLSGNQTAINATLATLKYTSDANYNGADTITVLSTDVWGGQDSDNVDINVAAVNDAPTLAIALANTTATAGTAMNAYVVASNAFTDVDNATLTYTATLADGSALSTKGLIFDATTRTISGTPTAAGTISVKVTASDGSLSASDTFDIVVAAANTAPINTVPATQTAVEDVQLAISGISVNDADGNLSSAKVSVLHGKLDITLSGGATISSGANASSTLTLSGTQTAINNSLATLKYTGAANYNGTDTLTVLSTDGQNVTDSDSLTINVTPVNDAPTGAVTISGTAKVGQVLTAANNVADVDGLGALTYSWFANGTAISGATASTYTLTATEEGKTITAKVSYTDGGNTAEQVISVATTVVAGLATGGQAVIPLDVGKLVQPLQMEGKWYYFWDRNSDGNWNVQDLVSHDLLDSMFKYDINGNENPDPSKNTTDVYRYATINGVQFSLPTVNGGLAYNTFNTVSRVSSSGTTNSSAYDELLAVADTYNESSLTRPWLDADIWAATPGATGYHQLVTLANGATGPIIDTNAILGSVVMQLVNANTAPVLDAAQSLTLSGVSASSAAPTGVTGDLVSSLVSGITDSDTGALKGIAITGVHAGGTLYYSLNGGTTWLTATGLSDSNALLLAADSNTRVFYKANGTSGTIADALTFRAWDMTQHITEGVYVDTFSKGGKAEFSLAFDTVSATLTPVVIDVNRDGVLSYGSVVMDVNGDGHLDQTAWAAAQDGVLVWDKLGDAKVHDNSQYAFSQYGAAGSTDLQGLAAGFDTNHDGVFNAADAKFGEFKVWQDANQNGVSDAGEVRSLADLGLAEINLTSDGVVRTPVDGVTEAGQTTATATDGSSVLVSDAGFAYSSLAYSAETVAGLGAHIDLLGSDMHLDLSSVVALHSNVAAVDLTGTGANSLKLNLSDVLGTAATNGVHTLTLTGDANDTVDLNMNEWTNTGNTVTEGEHTYAVYNASSAAAAQLLIDQHMVLTNHG